MTGRRRNGWGSFCSGPPTRWHKRERGRPKEGRLISNSRDDVQRLPQIALLPCHPEVGSGSFCCPSTCLSISVPPALARHSTRYVYNIPPHQHPLAHAPPTTIHQSTTFQLGSHWQAAMTANGTSGWQSKCGPSDLAGLRQAKLVGPAGPSGTSSSCVTISHKSSYWRCESAPWQGRTPATNPRKGQHKPRQFTCRRECPAFKALLSTSHFVLGLRRRRGR